MCGAGTMAIPVNTNYDIWTHVDQLQTSAYCSGGGRFKLCGGKPGISIQQLVQYSFGSSVRFAGISLALNSFVCYS